MGLKKTSSGYQSRLFLLISCFTWILTFAFFVLQYTREKEYKFESLNSQLQAINADLLKEINRNGNYGFLSGVNMTDADSLRITLIDFSGNIIFDSQSEDIKSNHSDRKEFVDAMANGQGYTVRRFSESVNNVYFYSATKGDSIVIRTALPYNDSLTKTLQVDRGYGYIIIIIAVVVNIIAYFAIRRIGVTVNNLREFATKAEEGSLDLSETYSFPQEE